MKVVVDLSSEDIRLIVVRDIAESIKCLQNLKTSAFKDKEGKKDLKALKRVLRYYTTQEERDKLGIKVV